MVTVREDGAKATLNIINDVKKSVFAWSPHNHIPRYVWLKTSAATVKPGMPVIRGTTAGGEGTCTGAAGSSILVYGFSELDKTQVADCSVAYATGDLIPVIPLWGNAGVILRNLHITDPSADIPPDQGWQSGNHLCTVGDGTGMIIVRSQQFIADADDPSYLVAYIAPSLDVVV